MDTVVSAKNGDCLCTNGGKPIDGFVYRSPSCPKHSGIRVIVHPPSAPPTAEELAEWKHPRAKILSR